MIKYLNYKTPDGARLVLLNWKLGSKQQDGDRLVFEEELAVPVPTYSSFISSIFDYRLDEKGSDETNENNGGTVAGKSANEQARPQAQE